MTFSPQNAPRNGIRSIRVFQSVMVFYFALCVLNIEALGLTANANPIEKVVLLAAGIIFMMIRGYDRFVLLMLAIIALVCFICGVLSSYPGFGLDRFFRSLTSFIAVFILLAGRPQEEDRDFLVRSVAFMPVASVAIGLIYATVGIRPLWAIDFLGATRLQGTSIPAGLGSICLVGVTAALFAFVFIRKPFYLMLAGVNFLILLLSAARMPLGLTILVGGVIYIAMIGTSAKKLAIALIGAVLFLRVIGLFFGQSIMVRLSSNSLSGRELIWAALDLVLDQYPAFGIGLGHQILIIPANVMKRAVTMAAHNEYLRLAVETGYIGAVSIFGLLGLLCIRLARSARMKNGFVFAIICISFFIFCRTDNAISSGNTSMILVLGAWSCLQYRTTTFSQRTPRTMTGRVPSSFAPMTS